MDSSPPCQLYKENTETKFNSGFITKVHYSARDLKTVIFIGEYN